MFRHVITTTLITLFLSRSIWNSKFNSKSEQSAVRLISSCYKVIQGTMVEYMYNRLDERNAARINRSFLLREHILKPITSSSEIPEEVMQPRQEDIMFL